MILNLLELFDKEDSDIVPLKDFIEKEQQKTWNKERVSKKAKINKLLDKI